ncbi:Ferric reductase transmembrane component [Lachnellula suecica]|uniref:Ferric reductase transmembrane component n=1 Tax=Lachnellula suecica TaxID=602035 RepID=A0A8T9CMU4_9HELO|nr:Ferric reductase transmembrane component [Lachnellula suecica]
MDPLARRAHIQEHSNTSYFVSHWGYVDRTLPCTNDGGSCEYLDAVYWMHDISMLYTFILWAVIGGVLLLIITLRFSKPAPKSSVGQKGSEAQVGDVRGSAYSRAWMGVQSWLRKWLLPEGFVSFFGNVTRLQILVFTILLGYLLIFSLVGIVYKTWITPVKNTALHNTRTGLGGFSDRVGAMAYALTPLTIALSTRESILTLITGIPYQSLNFLHRWTGRVIFIQSFLHTLGWTLIEGKFYQPQPSIYTGFIKETYIVWGIIAMALLTFLYVFSLQRVIRWTGHEFSRKAHYIVAGIYLGACWAHWSHLACWMIASLGLFGLDRGIRLLRTGLIHVGYLNGSKNFGFHSAQSTVEYFDDEDGGVVRMEFKHNMDPWAVGQHYFLCFPALTIWQSHPMTVASVPASHPTLPHHTYIIRCRKGETFRLKALALSQASATPVKETESCSSTTTPVILSGPYGTPLIPSLPNTGPEVTNILAIAGGTGISITLPVVLAATSNELFANAAIDFIWVIRRATNVQWIAQELEELKARAELSGRNLRMHIYVTQEQETSALETNSLRTSEKGDPEIKVTPVPAGCCSPQVVPVEEEKTVTACCASETGQFKCKEFCTTCLNSCHPSLEGIVAGFVESRASSSYRTWVIASGPAGMGSDLRAAVAKVNDGGRVWKGDMRWNVDLHWDDRMG